MMAGKNDGGRDEMMEGYASRYDLNGGLAPGLADIALSLVAAVRTLAHLRFANRNLAKSAHLRTSKRLMEIQLFHTSPHAGYHQLLHDMTVMLAAISERIDEKFPAEPGIAGSAADERRKHHADRLVD